MRTLVTLGLSLVLLAPIGCATGTFPDAGTGPGDDAGRRNDAGRVDSGGVDAGDDVDAGRGDCGGVMCMPFEFCDGTRCREYPPWAGEGSCPNPDEFCHNRRCIPGDVDIDGDGSPASEDCDETNPDRFPENEEICSTIDENCDGMVDEGDPAELC